MPRYENHPFPDQRNYRRSKRSQLQDLNDNLKAPQGIWRCIVSTIHYILHFTLHYIFVCKTSSNSYNWISFNASSSRLLKLIFRFREHFNKLLICKSSYEEPFLVSSSWPTLCIWFYLYFGVFDTKVRFDKIFISKGYRTCLNMLCVKWDIDTKL